MPGMSTKATYSPEEIRGLVTEEFISLPIIVEEGQDLDAGTVVGKRVATGKYGAYDKDGNASATVAVAGESNVGDGTFSTVEVQDAYTRTEDWEVTCTAEAGNGGTFSVVGSVSGDVGDAEVGVEFKYPNTSAYMIKFTISDGSEDFDEDDVFTFSTVEADALIAEGILVEDVDSTDGDVQSSMYVRGNFKTDKLTGMDNDAEEMLNGRYVGDYFFM